MLPMKLQGRGNPNEQINKKALFFLYPNNFISLLKLIQVILIIKYNN